MYKFLLILLLSISVFIPTTTFAKDNNFISVVNPVRGSDFWDLKNQKIETAVEGEAQILNNLNLPATWLLRFDALDNQAVLKAVDKGEKGLFLEVTPTWTKQSGVEYHTTSSWHSAGSAFLTGYEVLDREKLIDTAFDKYKSIFGNFPKSVGAWWIDAHSLSYMQQKYGITSALIVSDQYSTDNYQIWGQYFSTPYYPDKLNALHPAQSLGNKINLVISQWAPRDPVNSYGNGVFESTFSVQPNDYMDYHNLDIHYFEKLIDLYTNQPLNQFNSLVVGLENTYSWDKYKDEYKRQMEFLSHDGNIKIVSLGDFSSWYLQTFPNLSPSQVVVANDPLGSDKSSVWFMDPYYRAGWFYNNEGSVFRDIRQYIEGEKELCFDQRCDSVNFATSATRVLDEVSFGQKWLIDAGKISDLNVGSLNQDIVINYKNEANNKRLIELKPRDISVDGKTSSIDETILNAIKNDISSKQSFGNLNAGKFKINYVNILLETFEFLLFLVIGCLIPGLVLTKYLDKKLFLKDIFIGTIVGSVALTFTFYVLGLLHLRKLILLYLLIQLVLFIKFKLYKVKNQLPKVTKQNIFLLGLIIAGTIFQNIPTIKNGLVFPFGMGFWGPNTHDGIWHLSLINQLLKSAPPQNPIFAGETLKNYHYFYDLLVATTSFVIKISPNDLVFRFYPVLFSALLGLGTYYLVSYILGKANKFAVFLSIYFVYFTGSFGWIISYIKDKTLAGESAFWANQSISFNLNPPFAISLLIIICIFLLIPMLKNKWNKLILILLVGTLIAFKSYAAILILLTLALMLILNWDISFLVTLIPSSLISFWLLISNFDIGRQLIEFSPFWFIHSMIDSPDRVGWTRLTLTRIVGFETRNWFKFIIAEIIGFILFIVGNLGTRFISLFVLFKIKTTFKNPFYLLIFIFTIISFLIPILFIQSGNPWNTIQFLYYGLYTTSVVAGILIYRIFNKLPKISISLIIFILILTPINSITTSTYYMGYLPHGRIDNKELEALNFLSNQEDGIVLTYPYDEKLKKNISEPWPLFVYDSTAYVSAISKKPIFIEDEGQNQILLTDYKKRLISSKDFFNNPKDGLSFLKSNKIKYIYLQKIYNISIDTTPQIVKAFENDQVIVYKII